jgi:uncharacterized protein YraI
MKKRYLIIGGLILYAWVRLGTTPTHEGPPSPPSIQTEATTQKKKTSAERSQTPQRPEPSGKTVQSPTEKKEPSKAAATLMRTVRGNRVALREGPSTDYRIIDRFDRGRQVQHLDSQGEWSRVRDQITQREGWMASRFLPERQDTVIERPAKTTSKPKEISRSLPVISTSVIIQRIISDSIAAYPGSCPCPFNTDRGGRRCGKRSAYSKPGGYAPICFPQDVTKSMIDAFRERR